MGSELVKKQEILPAPIVTADNFEGLVREELGRIGEGFFRLGYYFEQAKNCRFYVPLGYDSVFELAEDLFDLKESSVYDMMAVWRRFHSNKDALALRDDCRGLKYSQLVECLRDKWSGGTVVRVISSTDTVKETRAKVTAWNTLVEKISGYPSLEQVEREVECAQLRKERKEAENSRRLENSAPELNGQLPGQTSLFMEGYIDEPQEQGQDEPENSRRLEFSEEETPEEEPQKFQTSGKTDENPFVGLPQETEIYADKLLKDMKAQAVEVFPDEVFPIENQMNIHKRNALSYIEIMEKATYAEGVDHFFDMAIKRLVAMRACKLQALKGAKK